MAQATIGDIKLIVEHMLSKQKSTLSKLTSGALYLTRLAQLKAEIDALPEALTSALPLKEQLVATDAEHDGYGAALWFLAQAYLRMPNASEEAVAAAQTIQTSFVTQLGELQGTYEEEAARALDRKPLLAKYELALKAIPVAGPKGTTALTVATSFLDRGAQLADLLAERAGTNAAQSKDGDRTKAGQIRSRGMGLLRRLREAVGDELAANETLPRDLATTLFAFTDQTFAQRTPPKSKTKTTTTDEPKP